MRSRCKPLLLLLILSAPPCLSQAQDVSSAPSFTVVDTLERAPYNEHRPDDAQWRAITSDRAFGYKDQTEYVAEPEPPKDSSLLRFLFAVWRFFTTTAGHIVLWSLLALIIGYILYRILSGEGRRLFARRSAKMTAESAAAPDETDLAAGNWEQLMQAAVQAGDLRAAVRYAYLSLLQLLQDRQLIQYRQDKTNSAYARELSGTELRQPFRDLSRQYEFTWYGNYPPSETGFGSYMQLFHHLKNRIGVR